MAAIGLTGGEAGAAIIIAPVFDVVAGSGPTDPYVFDTYSGPDPAYFGAIVLGFYNPGVTPTSLTANKPGQLLEYGAGVPADPTLVTQTIFSNNTNFVMTGFTLHIAGYGIQQSPDPLDLIFVEDPNVDAVWGDVSTGSISSNVFPNYTISPDGKTISFSAAKSASPISS
ncbi:MAG: hypothetical protein KDA46_10490 [Parvularculaceae bacterium]|nr:hypothetical protein [Parvularculaceae bacterium]